MSPILNQMLVLFILMVIGYAANKFSVMGKESERWISKLIVNITCPALIINSVVTADRLESNSALLKIICVAVAYFVVMTPVAKAIVKLLRIKRDHAPDYEAMLLYTNLGFMGIPVVSSVLGQQAILYLSIFMSIFNVSVFSYGIILLRKDDNDKLQINKVINPGTVSAVVAIILYICGVHLPDIVLTPIRSVGSVTTPLAMLVIGSSLANQPVKSMFTEKDMLPFALIRLLILPVAVLFICKLFISDPMLLGVLTLCSAMPVASNVVMICNELGRDTSYISKGVFVSTVLSVVTISLVSMLLQKIVL